MRCSRPCVTKVCSQLSAVSLENLSLDSECCTSTRTKAQSGDRGDIVVTSGAMTHLHEYVHDGREVGDAQLCQNSAHTDRTRSGPALLY